MYEGPLYVRGLYKDRRHNVRRVVGMGPQFANSPTQKDKNCLRYEVVRQASGPYRPGTEVNCTEQSFRRWALQQIPPPYERH